MELKSCIEILDFYQPRNDNMKNLYIKNINVNGCGCDSENNIEERLWHVFSQYGLIYETQVFPTGFKQNDGSSSNKSKALCSVCFHPQDSILNFYAFVKFFSKSSAAKAKQVLHLTHFIGNDACKVSFARRQKGNRDEERFPLNSARCKEILNYYLGFNGWTSSVSLLGDSVDDSSQQTDPGSDHVKHSKKEWSYEVLLALFILIIL